MVEFFPNSRQPVPEVMTAIEACRYLRLDEDRNIDLALKSLRRLVDKQLLHPCRLGRHNRFARHELARLVRQLTDQRSNGEDLR